MAGGADPAVPRHHPGLVDRLGARRRRGGPRPHRRRARGSGSRGAAGRAGAGRARCSPTPPTARPRRGRRRRRRRSTARSQRLADGRLAFRARVPGLGVAPAVALAADDRVVVTDRTMTNGRLAVQLGPRRQPALDHRRRPRPRAAARRRSSAAVLELAVDQPVALRRVGPRGVGARRPGAPDRRPTRVRSSSRAARRRWCGCNGRSGRRRPTLTYVLRAGSPRLDVEVDSTGTTTSTCCRWRSRSTCAPTRRRAASSSAPCAGRRTRRASWDAAKFEVCAHRYVDVAEPSFGVAVLNDGRYGHRVFDGGRARQPGPRRPLPRPRRRPGPPRVTVSVLPHGPGLPTSSPRPSASTSRCASSGGAASAPTAVAGAGRRRSTGAASRSTP